MEEKAETPQQEDVGRELWAFIPRELKSLYYAVSEISGIVVTLFIAIYFADKGLKLGAAVFGIFAYLSMVGYGLILKERLGKEFRESNLDRELVMNVLVMLTALAVVTLIILASQLS